MVEKIDLWTIKDVADYLGFKPITVYRLTRKRKIDVILLGKEYRFTKEAVDKYIKSITLPAIDKPTTEDK